MVRGEEVQLDAPTSCDEAVSQGDLLSPYRAANSRDQCNEIFEMMPNQSARGNHAAKAMWSLFQANARPRCRITPRTSEEVALILERIVAHSCVFAVLGGGTSPFAGASNANQGITIDLGLLNSVQFHEEDSTVVAVGGGARWADVYRFLDPLNLSSAGTRNSLTGVVGSILGGQKLSV